MFSGRGREACPFGGREREFRMRAGATARYPNRWIYIAEATKRGEKGGERKKERERKLTNELQSIWDGDT